MLTVRELHTYQFIRNFILRFDRSPTEKEVMQGLGLNSKGVVHRYIQSVVKAGLLEKTPGKRRSLRLVDHCLPNYSQLPVIGSIPAGIPNQPNQDVYENKYLDLSSLLLGSRNSVLRVTDTALQDEHICPGDFVVYEPCDAVLDGSRVLVVIQNKGAMVGRFSLNEDRTCTLRSLQSDGAQHTFSEDQVEVVGLYLGLIRLQEGKHTGE